MKQFPFCKQPDSMECGATCLRMIAAYYGREYTADAMQPLCLTTNTGVSMLSLSDAAEAIGFRTVCGRIGLHISTRINISLISDFLIKLMRLPMAFFDSKLLGDLIQRIDDPRRVEHFLTAQTQTILFSVFSFVIFGGVLLYYNLMIFLVFLAGSILYTAWVFIFLKKRRLLDYELFEQRSRNHSKTVQMLNGMQEIKLQRCESRRRWEWEDIQADLFKINVDGMKLQQSQEAGSLLVNFTSPHKI